MKTINEYAILVVDDDCEVTNLLKKQLNTTLGLNVLTSNSVENALAVLKEHLNIAVLICDMDLNGKKGTLVLKEAKKINPYVISMLCTGKAEKDDIIETINECEIKKFIGKPWSHSEITRIVKEAIREYHKTLTQQKLLQQLVSNVLFKNTEAISPDCSSDDTKTVNVEKRYKIKKLIRRGGNSNIYLAEDLLLKMPVAIKHLKDSFSKDADRVAQLFEEARVAMQLSHRHIVRLYNLQEHNGSYYLIMEYIDGITLREVIHRYGPLKVSIVAQILDVCAEAFAYAHRHNVFHRDIKPDNIMLDNDGVLKIIDFGLAFITGRPMNQHWIYGTPYYMSPEEFYGRPIDARSDVFSMGVTIHELLTGCMPFQEGITNPPLDEYVPHSNKNLPKPLAYVLDKAMAIDPKERYPDMLTFSREFKKAVNIITS